jgi:hypothetical protein
LHSYHDARWDARWGARVNARLPDVPDLFSHARVGNPCYGGWRRRVAPPLGLCAASRMLHAQQAVRIGPLNLSPLRSAWRPVAARPGTSWLGHSTLGFRSAFSVVLMLSSTNPFLVENRLANIDAFTTNVDFARPLDERAHVAIVLAAEGAAGVRLSERERFVAPQSAEETDHLARSGCQVDRDGSAYAGGTGRGTLSIQSP